MSCISVPSFNLIETYSRWQHASGVSIHHYRFWYFRVWRDSTLLCMIKASIEVLGTNTARWKSLADGGSKFALCTMECRQVEG